MIAFHGTDKLAAEKVLKTGFRIGTYFAFQKKVAFFFGGPVVFTARFKEAPECWKGEPDGFQFYLRDPHPKGNIVKTEFLRWKLHRTKSLADWFYLRRRTARLGARNRMQAGDS